MELIQALGGKCASCGEKDATKLEVDHVDGCTWSRRGMGMRQRVERYWAEYREGIPLQALCRTCNAVDGAIRGQAWWQEQGQTDNDEPTPF